MFIRLLADDKKEYDKDKLIMVEMNCVKRFYRVNQLNHLKMNPLRLNTWLPYFSLSFLLILE